MANKNLSQSNPIGNTSPDKFKRNNAPLEIYKNINCWICREEVPNGTTIQQYSQLAVGWTDPGIQIWCERHQINIFNFDFAGQIIRDINSGEILHAPDTCC